MILRPFLYEPTSCASYLFGCPTHGRLAVVDPHEALVDEYLAAAGRVGRPIVAVLETHVQADHVSGMAALVEATGATAYLPAGADVSFPHHPLSDGERLDLGNSVVTALATPPRTPPSWWPTGAAAPRSRGSPSPATPCWWATSAGPTSTAAIRARWPGRSTPRWSG
mgnify:CR=1 FL=1